MVELLGDVKVVNQWDPEVVGDLPGYIGNL